MIRTLLALSLLAASQLACGASSPEAKAQAPLPASEERTGEKTASADLEPDAHLERAEPAEKKTVRTPSPPRQRNNPSSGAVEQAPLPRERVPAPVAEKTAAREAPADPAPQFPSIESKFTRQQAVIHPPSRPWPKSAVIPEGTVLGIRLVGSLSTEHNSAGDEFESVLEGSLSVDENVVVPQGSPVTGTLVEVREPGKAKGRAAMTFTLTEIRIGEEMYPIQTNQITIQAEATKGQDANKIGVAAGLGALIGGILGGKKGAAVGAAAGGGAGAAGVLLSKGSQVTLNPEQYFSFRLETDLPVVIR